MDREKVVRALEYWVSFGGASQQSMVMQIATEALVLLKEQEVKEQISDAIHETAKQFRQTIVRCKECRYSEHDPEIEHLRCQHPVGLSGMTHGADWFCADGERE